MKALTATLRLQFHKGFTLDDAVPLVPYFAKLGISHLYASPLLKARPGSMHGYDVVDPTVLNPELGGEPALERLSAALGEHGMGLLLDIVSNHMAVGGAHNPWWLDLLEWGRASPYAEFFDVKWHSTDPMLEGQMLLPFLASDYGAMLQAGDIPLRFDADTGAFRVEHYEHHFPISPPDYGELLRAAGHSTLDALASRFDALAHADKPHADARKLRRELAEALSDKTVAKRLEQILARYDSTTPQGLPRLHRLLERQHYRLASWRTAADDINWRRFFDINELGGLRVERPAVFEATHRKIFELVEQGQVQGLRIDHVDGLADPRSYTRKLRRRVDSLGGEHLPIFVEKILGNGERLHRDWSVDGTTGYDFMNQVSLVQHDPAGQATLAELWEQLSGRTPDFLEEVRQARQFVLNGTLAGDFESVAQALLQVARCDLMSRDLTLGAIRRALQALIVHYSVYRTYINACGRPAEDEPFFERAVEGARAALSEADAPVLDYLVRWLGGEGTRQLPPGRARKLLRNACIRFQQLTAPTAAKSVEDTAFYRSAVLLSRNDVGFDPEVFSAPVEAFHDACQQRQTDFPDNLLATATHDHKRGEDSRARLAVLSERATWYARQVRQWHGAAARLRQSLGDQPAPSGGDELLLYQALLGSWPLDLTADDADGLAAYAERLRTWQQKALREAKLASSWNAPNEAYENACHGFLDGLLLAPEHSSLRQSIAAAATTIAPAGALNSLVQTALRLTVPGVPDLYQGTEFWDFSLVDPDNRRPVDFAIRTQHLNAGRPLSELLAHWRDGAIKQHLIATVLGLRAQWPELFQQGDYQPLPAVGEHADKVLAFVRQTPDQRVVVIVPRLAAHLLGDSEIPSIPAQNWGDTHLILPSPRNTRIYQGLLGGGAVTPERELRLAVALKDFPVNLYLETES